MITAVFLLAVATGSPQAATDPCNHVAQPKSQTTAALPSTLRAKYPGGATVRMLLEVDSYGAVTGAGMWGSQAKTDPQLAEVAAKAAMHMTFSPTTVNCKPIADRFFYDLSLK